MSVYFAQKEQGGLIKIGWSRSVASRLQNLGAKLLGAIPGDEAVEKKIHQLFAHLRSHHEWFNPADELLEFIQTKGQTHVPDERSRYVAVRLPKSLLDRTDKIAESLSTPGMRVTRADIQRRALYLGIEQLESVRGPKKTRG